MQELTELLNSLAPLLAAFGGVLAGVVALVKNLPKIKRMLLVNDQTPLIVELRELADTRLEMLNITKEQLAAEIAAHVETAADLAFARRSADEADRQKNLAYDLLADCRENKFLELRP